MMKKVAVAIVILSLMFPALGFADEEAVVADFLVRPLGFVGLTLGSAAFVVALPVSIVVGGTDRMAETLVMKPYRFTFQRDMGEGLELFDEDPDW
jgi:hypothetical protein